MISEKSLLQFRNYCAVISENDEELVYLEAAAAVIPQLSVHALFLEVRFLAGDSVKGAGLQDVFRSLQTILAHAVLPSHILLSQITSSISAKEKAGAQPAFQSHS